MNYNDALHFLGLDTRFSTGKPVFLILGISNILDLAVGVTAVMIATSPAWRFEFYCGVILLLLSIPLNIVFTRWQGMQGAAIAIMITFIVYNLIRLFFIRYRFNMWPFTRKTIYALLLITGSYLVTWFLLRDIHGLPGMLLRSTLFSGFFLGGVFYFQLTPDLPQFIAVIKKKLGREK
jgi:O-antigen/teichoic acid export membrane protein